MRAQIFTRRAFARANVPNENEDVFHNMVDKLWIGCIVMEIGGLDKAGYMWLVLSTKLYDNVIQTTYYEKGVPQGHYHLNVAKII